MAAKFGKREKIVTGSIVGIAVVAALHILVFQPQGRNLDEAQRRRDDVGRQVSSYPRASDRAKIDQIKTQTQRNQELLWKAVLDMDLLIPDCFLRPGIAEPIVPWESTNEAAVEQYNKAKEEYDKVVAPKQVQAEAIITERLDRLIEMKKAYEAGEPWKGDLPPREGDETSRPRTLKLSFLDAGPLGWNLPIALRPELASPARLWDEVNHLYNLWDVLSYLSPDSEGYLAKETDYINQLRNMGLDVDRFFFLQENLGEFLPEFVSLLFARLIWKQRRPQETITVGQKEEVTLDLLKQMFSVQIPEYWSMVVFDRQLSALEAVLPLARRNRIDEIQVVVLHPEYRIANTYASAEVMRAKRPATITTTPGRRRPITVAVFTPTTGRSRPPVARPVEAVAIPQVGQVVAQGASGGAVLMTMRYSATNENSTRFLYELVNDLGHYIIEGVTLYGQEQDRVIVDLTVNRALAVGGISLPHEGMLDLETGLPNSDVGRRMMEERQKELERLGLDMKAVTQKALADANVTVQALTSGSIQPVSPAVPEATPAASDVGSEESDEEVDE